MTDFVLDPAAVDEMLSNPGGPLWLYIAEKTVAVEEAAIVEAPVNTGRLSNEIVSKVVDRGIPVGIVTADTTYADYVIRGTQAHVITASAGKMLRFPNQAGTIIYRNKVDHPGTPANDFLGRALQAVFE